MADGQQRRAPDIERHIANGRIAEALRDLQELEASCGQDQRALHQLALWYTQLGRHERAYACAGRCLKAGSPTLENRYLLVGAAIAVGQFDEADEQLEIVISTQPDEAEAYYTRATLRRQVDENNHVDQLRTKLSKLRPGSPAEVPLCYALGKELEDLGSYADAFAHIHRGASARCARLSYDVRGDMQVMQDIAATFDESWWDATPSGEDASGPIFVLGLPRSGTTLVERILGSHVDVASLGETNDFTYSVMRSGSPAADKDELMRNVAAADMRRLGREYWQALLGYGEQSTFLIDKTPGNFLYLGLIAKALPGARILHVHRHPMASCYAMYKSLFRMGYPFSYDLQALGKYWLEYNNLMTHWHSLFGDRILDVSYENLVDDLETVSRQVVEHAGLEWSDACLRFHESTAPTATASAAQVRTPLYRSARDLWRQYERQLSPLRDILSAGGAQL